ncbi:MAG: two-component system, chemotaxis family, protein-glutamate methylesterase/glutaminase, partial [Micromonosporaceae bacterium]|nr:two-component system, chemotaxis family, protein-glutamate methylesterase/glutaminase [Micromonosporaceae bacterium]
MGYRDVVVVGGSAGGVEAARDFIASLPAELPAAVLVVIHMPAGLRSALPNILDRCGALPTVPAEHGQALRPGHVYVAVPDHHLLIHEDTIRLSRSARQNRLRPAVDALFRSAARWTGPRTIGAVLSGALDDGAVGLAAIHARGGAAVIQDPDTAIFDGMPRAALAAVDGDATVGRPAELAARVTELVRQQVAWPTEPADRDLILETDMAEHDHPNGRERPGRPAGLGCPECNGGLSIVGNSGTE